MVVKNQKFRGQTLAEKAIACENIGICIVCNKKIKSNNLRAGKIDGLWLCGPACSNKFLEEKKKWTPEDWDELCKMQASCAEQKQAEINNAKK